MRATPQVDIQQCVDHGGPRALRRFGVSPELVSGVYGVDTSKNHLNVG